MTASAPRRAGPGDVAKTVLAGLLGVRRKSDHERASITPLQVIVAALVLVALFIGALITVVHLVTA